MILRELFALSLLFTLTLGWSAGQDVIQAGTEAVRLEVEAEPGILVSRLNPPIIELSNPFKCYHSKLEECQPRGLFV